MPQFPLPDMGTLTSIADLMRNRRQDSRAAQDAQIVGAQHQANLGRQAAIESDYARRQDEISARATAYDVRGRERSEDFAHAELMQQRQHDFAREQQYGKQAFKLQSAGQRVGAAPLRPGGVPSGVAPTSYTQQVGDKTYTRPVRPSGGLTRDMLPQLFPNPARQKLAQDLWDRGEYDQVRIMADKTAGLNDPENTMKDLDATVRQLQGEINRMEEDKADGLPIDEMGLKLLKSMRNRAASEGANLQEQKRIMTDPNAKQSIHDIKDVPPPEVEAAVAEVYKLANKDFAQRDPAFEAQPDFMYQLTGMLRAQGYDIQLMVQSRQFGLPKVPPPPTQQQEPGPVDLAAKANAMQEDAAHRDDTSDMKRDGLKEHSPAAAYARHIVETGAVAAGAVSDVYDIAKMGIGIKTKGFTTAIGDRVSQDWRYIFSRDK